MVAFTEFLLPSSVMLFIIVIGISLFKNFLKIIVVVALIIGGIVFFAQDSFALGIKDFLPSVGGLTEDEKEEPKIKSVGDSWVVQDEDGNTTGFKKKVKFMIFSVSSDNHMKLYDFKARIFDLGELSDATVKNIMKKFFGKVELLNIKEGEE